MKESSYAILGLGRYGRRLMTLLASTGAEILIADDDSEVVNMYADKVTRAVSLDLSNPAAIEKIGLENVDITIVDLSKRLEASIMCIMVARESGVKEIIATASADRFKETMLKVGADEVVIPEDEAAVRIARRLISEDFMEYYDIGGGLCVIKAHPKKEWTGRSLMLLDLPRKENVRIIAVEQEDGSMEMSIDPSMVLQEDSVVAIVIPKSRIYDLI